MRKKSLLLGMLSCMVLVGGNLNISYVPAEAKASQKTVYEIDVNRSDDSNFELLPLVAGINTRERTSSQLDSILSQISDIQIRLKLENGEYEQLWGTEENTVVFKSNDRLYLISGYSEDTLDKVQDCILEEYKIDKRLTGNFEEELTFTEMQELINEVKEYPIIQKTNIEIKNNDKTPPTLKLHNTAVEMGEDISPEQIVKEAVDADGNEIEYSVEGLSEVNTEVPGEYEITVSAEDRNGNTVTEETTVEILDDIYRRIADAAIAQEGVQQHCVSLVRNSLAAVGIDYNALVWNGGFDALGTRTDNPVAGDVIVYPGHVAIYLGDGMAVHGGYPTVDGYTVITGAKLNSKPISYYIHPYHP